MQEVRLLDKLCGSYGSFAKNEVVSMEDGKAKALLDQGKVSLELDAVKANKEAVAEAAKTERKKNRTRPVRRRDAE